MEGIQQQTKKEDELKTGYPVWVQTLPTGRGLTLHDEIEQFVAYVTPTPQEMAARNDLIQRVSKVVNTLWPTAFIKLFGSFQSGLLLPCSDLMPSPHRAQDICVMGASKEKQLEKLSKALERAGVAKDVQLIPHAKVDEKTGYRVDISFDIVNGPENTKLMSTYLDNMPALRPLALVLKYFLYQRGLNETYSGGIGSYTLLLLIISFLQFHSVNKNITYKETDLGTLLIDFFDLYGTKFNFFSTAISVRNGGRYFAKTSREGWSNPTRLYLLAVEDPHDIESDVGKNSYNILNIRASFYHAYHALLSPETLPGFPTPLSRICSFDESIVKHRMMINELFSHVKSVPIAPSPPKPTTAPSSPSENTAPSSPLKRKPEEKENESTENNHNNVNTGSSNKPFKKSKHFKKSDGTWKKKKHREHFNHDGERFHDKSKRKQFDGNHKRKDKSRHHHDKKTKYDIVL